MIRSQIIVGVAVLLIYSHSTDAEISFNKNKEIIEEHLLDERTTPTILDKTIGKIIPYWEGIDILCDLLYDSEKQAICDEIMLHLIDDDYGPVFQSFDSDLPVPAYVGSGDSFKCQGRSVDKLDMQKRMFWCNSRRFIQRQSSEYGEEEGFFCAGSRKVPGRIYAFRPPTLGSPKVSPVGELNDVDEILQFVSRDDDSEENSSSASSSSDSIDSTGDSE